MIQFKCDNCGKRFENPGKVLEYHSPAYGPCSKRVADCPECGAISDEYRPPRQMRSKDSRVRGTQPAPGCCPSGGCCFSG